MTYEYRYFRVPDAGNDEDLEVLGERPCTIYVLNDHNYTKFKLDQRWEHAADEWAHTFPHRMPLPGPGRWHVLIRPDGDPIGAKYSVQTVSR